MDRDKLRKSLQALDAINEPAVNRDYNRAYRSLVLGYNVDAAKAIMRGWQRVADMALAQVADLAAQIENDC